MSVIDRLFDKIRFRDCWEWQAGKDRYGYGAFYKDGTMKIAHRVVYEELVGAIPNGLTLDHLCSNRGCVNPSHLEPVTIHENRARAGIFERERGGTCKHGHLLDGSNLRVTPKGKLRCVECYNGYNRKFVANKKVEIS